jgi:hypothetical protein
MKRANNLLVIGFIAIAASVAQAQLPFFPGAEGFGGSFTGTAPVGGWFSNAEIYRVTTTQDYLGLDGKGAPGTLRGAFRENTANKIIIFDVGGTFQLTEGSLDIKNVQNYYIAGQTAPSPVTIYGDTTQITHSNNKQHFNTVLRYMTFRKGTGEGEDAITFSGGGTNGIATNMIIDHVSASWSEDEVLSVTNYNTNVTVQYTMMTDSLTSGHQYGSLMRAKTDNQVTFHHNLYANDKSRNPRMGSYDYTTLTLDFVNNVIYNWSDRAGYAGGGSDSGITEKVNVNWVGNYGIAGPATPNGNASTTIFTKDTGGTNLLELKVYQDLNLIDSNHNATRDGTDTGWGMFKTHTGGALPEADKTLTRFATPPVTTTGAASAYDQVVEYVGNFWWARDVIDQRIIGNVENNTQPAGGIPALAPVPSELSYVLSGAYPAAPTTHAAGYDLDNDGMQDAWETIHGGNLNPMLDFDSDGYINLMEFINEKGEFPAPAPIVFNGSANTRYANIMNWKTNDGGITAGSNWQPSKYDVAVINNGNVVVDAVGQHAGVLQIAPNTGNTATLSVNSGWLKAESEVQVGSATGDGTLTIATAGTVFAPVVSVDASGELNGAGDIVGNVLNNGLVSPGSSPGTLDVSGNFAQNAGGVLKMEIASTSSVDQLNIGGALMAGGTLDVDLLSFSPVAGNTFDLFDFASSIGSFSLDLPTLGSGLEWFTDNLLVTGELSVVSASVVDDADFDGDGDVDGRDFLTWQRGFGLTEQQNNSLGDANGDGDVDAADLAIWQTQYGQPTELAATQAAVPEPASIVLLATLGLAALGRRSRIA